MFVARVQPWREDRRTVTAFVARRGNVSDPLSDVFSLLQLRNLRCTRLEAAGVWGLAFRAQPMLKFVAVLRGTCWISVTGMKPSELAAGDAFLLVNANGYAVSSGPRAKLKDGNRLFEVTDSDVVRLGGGADTVLIGGSFIVEGNDLSPLLDVLPSFLAIPSSNPAAASLHTTLGLLDGELSRPGIGGSLMAKHLADILLLQALRAHAISVDADSLGWIGALADKHIGAALALMHAQPGMRWTVDKLAAAAGLSRSSFAARFKLRLGVAPLEYLLQWRMRRARHLLRQGDVSIGNLAAELGYASESAFGNAFKRFFGKAPGSYWAGAAGADEG